VVGRGAHVQGQGVEGAGVSVQRPCPCVGRQLRVQRQQQRPRLCEGLEGQRPLHSPQLLLLCLASGRLKAAAHHAHARHLLPELLHHPKAHAKEIPRHVQHHLKALPGKAGLLSHPVGLGWGGQCFSACPAVTHPLSHKPTTNQLACGASHSSRSSRSLSPCSSVSHTAGSPPAGPWLTGTAHLGSTGTRNASCQHVGVPRMA
jgi:hypothetical protein